VYSHTPDDTIAALSTPAGEGGIAIVRLSGCRALDIADRIFIPRSGGRPSESKTYTVHYGHVVDTERGTGDQLIDEALLTAMRAPKSYTREDTVEVNCHGGIQAAKRTLGMMLDCGARTAEPGEFTKRAFLNGRIDLVQAEAVLDIIAAKTEGSLRAAVSQLEGVLSERVDAIRVEIVDIAAQIEAAIDFPEEDTGAAASDIGKKTDNVLKDLKDLIDTFGEGMIFREGALAVICGKPNVGKSSLMNLLLKRDRVIVTPVPGTTRDTVEEMINLRGLPVRLVDTAGIGEAKDDVEREGVRRSRSSLNAADMVLLMLDASTGIEVADREILKMTEKKKRLVILNKIDLKEGRALEGPAGIDDMIEISVLKRTNIELLEKAMVGMIWNSAFNQAESAMVTNARHKALLDKAHGNMASVADIVKDGLAPELAAVELSEAIFNLGLIVGRSVSDDVLDRIFENFCIGK
jgi:tRNA modification GTPase